MLPRRDLLLGTVRLDLPAVTQDQLRAFKRFVWALAVPNLGLVLAGFWLLGAGYGSTAQTFALALILLSLAVVITLIRSADNYDTLSEAQAEALSRMADDKLLPPMALGFIREVEGSGRVLSRGEAYQLIELGRKARTARNMTAISDAANEQQSR